MKKALLLVLIVFLLASCNLFTEVEEKEKVTSDSVEVKLFIPELISSKALEFGYYTTATESTLYHVYQYKASPKFTSSDTQGEKTSWTDFTNGSSIGYFTQGKWEFEVRELYGKSSTSYSVLREGSVLFYVKTSSNSVTVPVVDNVATSTDLATVKFSINVSALNDDLSKHKLSITVDGTSVTPTDLVLTTQSDGAIVNFAGSIDCENGYHTVGFSYSCDGSLINADAVVVRAVTNGNVLVSGSMDSGSFGTTTLTVSYNQLSLALSGKTTITTKSSTTITCTCTNASNNATYKWYKNGQEIPSATSYQYSFSDTTPGIYTLTCVVTDPIDTNLNVMGSSSINVTVN